MDYGENVVGQEVSHRHVDRSFDRSVPLFHSLAQSLSTLAARRGRGRGVVAVADAAVVVGGTCEGKEWEVRL
jgi:hypothetical protein